MLSSYIIPLALLDGCFLFFLIALLLFIGAGLLVLFSRRESNHVSYRAEAEAVTDSTGTREQHHHALDTASPATGRRQAIVESLDKALVQRSRIAIFVFKRLVLWVLDDVLAFWWLGNLNINATIIPVDEMSVFKQLAPLGFWIVLFFVHVGQFAATDEKLCSSGDELKGLGAYKALCQWRHASRVVHDKNRLREGHRLQVDGSQTVKQLG
ncbi:hypothetical protein HG531_001833 [Fusarium graminearum]|nr:hypothetical protein HG531_001833 [Fusarium graminearum]